MLYLFYKIKRTKDFPTEKLYIMPVGVEKTAQISITLYE